MKKCNHWEMKMQYSFSIFSTDGYSTRRIVFLCRPCWTGENPRCKISEYFEYNNFMTK